MHRTQPATAVERSTQFAVLVAPNRRDMITVTAGMLDPQARAQLTGGNISTQKLPAPSPDIPAEQSPPSAICNAPGTGPSEASTCSSEAWASETLTTSEQPVPARPSYHVSALCSASVHIALVGRVGTLTTSAGESLNGG